MVMRRNRRRAARASSLLLAVLIIMMVAVGCDRSSTGAGEGAQRESAADEQVEGATSVDADDSGDSSEGAASEREANETPKLVQSDDLPDEPERIVSLAPNVTEMLFALGAGDRVVARTKYCDHPEDATDLPSVGSFANPDFESIVAKEPELVVGVVSGGSKQVFERLESVEVPYLFVRTDTIDETFDGIEAVGDAIGEGKAADALTTEMRERLDELGGRWQPEEPPSVLLVYGHEPLVAAGPGTFGHQLLEAAGATNVLADADTSFPRLDIEKVVELNPDRILDTAMVNRESDDEFWRPHEAIEAVAQGRVSYLTDPVVLRPGPRLPEALERFGEALYGADGSDTAAGSE
jgi:iron complex transport system substrate-binding protein